ncbi:phosphotransferase [Aeromicrobium sp. Marseille-Q0843]|uniref:Phosphotransferase n=1 Tax=Aeromicrobium phoceense TaxID=2754045 RepID=A0A838XI17_9ACTN|nr:phosphotransferase [Aeromicrobium phoceense]MBA4608276.1 phosphotransferase [Aeromicrobium phoceense]
MCHDASVARGEEIPEHLPGGSGGVWRVGRTVRRPTGPWTPAVHELLDWLAGEGLGGIPHVSGLDEDDREVVSYIEGRGVPVDDEVVLDTVLVEAVAWLRDFHDIVEDFRPDGPRTWRQAGEVELGDDEIICHNDPGAYNWIIQSGHFVAMIDWDLAGPGQRIDDLAFLCWTAIPLYREIPLEDVVRRLDLVVDTYAEWGPMALLDAVVARMTTATERIAAGIERGDPGMLNLARKGEPQRTRDRLAAFEARLPAIRAAL